MGEAYVNQHVALVRLHEIKYAPYIWLWLISPEHGRSQLLDAAYGGGKPGLNLSQIRNVRLSIPSLPEQREIVRRVNVLFRFADMIEEQVLAATTKGEQLTQSILAKAFRGELVPQNPKDEPASELLKRIAEERGRMEAGKRTKPRGRRKVVGVNQ